MFVSQRSWAFLFRSRSLKTRLHNCAANLKNVIGLEIGVKESVLVRLGSTALVVGDFDDFGKKPSKAWRPPKQERGT